jgi:beta-glucosidase
MRNGFFTIFFLALLMVFSCRQHREDKPLYRDATLPTDKRVEDLLSRMTLEEKFWQLYMIPGDLSDGKEKYSHGIFGFQVSVKGRSAAEQEQMLDYSSPVNAEETAKLINSIQHYFVEETRLGIPVIPFDEALHGLVREGATMFPQSVAMAATWNPQLVGEAATAIAMETRSRGIRQILSPVLDIARDVRWGRVEETYGEDPFLVSRMGVAFVSAFERKGIVATPKHFVANFGEGGRDSYPIEYSDRLMNEVYFEPYRAVIKEAGARSIMASYNSWDGRPCTANQKLLKDILKNEWGFRGFVISDAGATGGSNVLHFITATYPESTREALESGMDVIFQTSYDHYRLFIEAFEKGMIKMETVNEAVRRVLRVKFELGLFENPYVNPAEASLWNGRAEHRALAEEVAMQSFVLLKNEHSVLPLDSNVRSIALIGSDAIEARLGGYSGPGNQPVSILQGMRKHFSSNTEILYAPGCGRSDQPFKAIPGEYLSSNENKVTKPGLKAAYFNNITLAGKPVLERTDPQIAFGWTLFSPEPEKVNYDFFSVRWTGKLRGPATGTFLMGIEGDDGYRIWLDGKLILDNWKKQGFHLRTVDVKLKKDQLYDLRIEFFESAGNVRLKLIWDFETDHDADRRIAEAVTLARRSDIAVVVAGIEEGEFRDRALLGLPGRQEELIRAVAATGKPLVVLLVGGSAVTMQSWVDDADAIMQVWYPGEAGGSAVARVLKGEYNPAGRLPFSWPVHEGQLPLYYNHKPTGRGDDYLNLTGKPMFPFGFGLSYTTFNYSDLKISSQKFKASDSLSVSCRIANTGDRDGDEVVQLYLKDIFASVVRPVIELKGFKRIHLKAGESITVNFLLTPDCFSFYDLKMKKSAEPGVFRILIGTSSNSIQLRSEVELIK